MQLLLGYLPPSHDLWEKELTENRQKYAKLKEELLLSPVRCSPSFMLSNYISIYLSCIIYRWFLCTNQNLESRQSELARKKGGAMSFCDPPADSAIDGPLKRREISPEDHPLSLGKASVWHQYFQVNCLLI